MLASRDKISIRQAMIILVTSSYTISLKAIPNFSAKVAKQAAWLSPVICLAVVIPILLIFSSIYKKYKEESFTEIIEDILGTVIGKIVTVIYIIEITVILAVDTRDFVEKIASTIFPNVHILIFIVVMLITVAITLRKGGIVVLARMTEIIFIFLITLFLLMFVLASKDIKISRLTPISYLDFFPLLKASTSVLTIWAHISFIFLLSNYINNKEKIKKVCIKASIFLAILTMLLLIVTIGLLGASTIELSTIPYITSIKQLSIFEVFERLEAIVVSLWILSDFVIISFLLFTILNMYKSLLKLSDTKPFITIYLVIIYFLSLLIGRNVFELDIFGSAFIFPANIFLGYIMPILVFTVGKIRRKI